MAYHPSSSEVYIVGSVWVLVPLDVWSPLQPARWILSTMF